MSAHGIRTFGTWQKTFAEALSGSPTKVKAFEFGRYDLLRFKWPYFNNRKLEKFFAWYFCCVPRSFLRILIGPSCLPAIKWPLF